MEDRQRLQIGFHDIIEYLPHRSSCPSHDPFHAVCGAQKMGLVNVLGTAETDNDILAVPCHASHLMGNDLA